jgi:hypothetical protein
MAEAKAEPQAAAVGVIGTSIIVVRGETFRNLDAANADEG